MKPDRRRRIAVIYQRQQPTGDPPAEATERSESSDHSTKAVRETHTPLIPLSAVSKDETPLGSAAETPEARAERLLRLKAQIQAGTYAPNTSKIARILIHDDADRLL